jgi:hypothetical protein
MLYQEKSGNPAFLLPLMAAWYGGQRLGVWNRRSWVCQVCRFLLTLLQSTYIHRRK